MNFDNFPKLLEGKKIIFGVCGSVAIYKSIEVLRNLQKLGAKVRVVMSGSAEQFITPLLFESLSGYRVLSQNNQSWGENPLNHIEIAAWGDLFVIAPISANSINKITYGIADNVLLESFLAFDKKKIIAPAANTKMLENQITLESIKTLKQSGIRVIKTQNKELACKTIGNGALAEPLEITYQIIKTFLENDFWRDREICISSGGSREKIDSVRYLSNYSSGKMGASLALMGYFLGARVTYVGSLLPYTFPLEIQKKYVESSEEFFLSIKEWQLQRKNTSKSFLFMGAAISDYIPKVVMQNKQKKEELGKEWNLALKENIDILQNIEKSQITIGFKLENQNGIKNAQESMAKKNLDAVCLNEISETLNPMDSDENQIIWIDKTSQKDLGRCDKITLALKILKEAESL